MKRMILAVCAALALSGCAALGNLAGGLPPSPAAAADQTTLDEQALLAVELAYKAARTAAELAVDAGVLKGEAATRVAVLDNQAFLAVTLARSAYKTGNAQSYKDALGEAQKAVAALLALTGRN